MSKAKEPPPSYEEATRAIIPDVDTSQSSSSFPRLPLHPKEEKELRDLRDKQHAGGYSYKYQSKGNFESQIANRLSALPSSNPTITTPVSVDAQKAYDAAQRAASFAANLALSGGHDDDDDDSFVVVSLNELSPPKRPPAKGQMKVMDNPEVQRQNSRDIYFQPRTGTTDGSEYPKPLPIPNFVTKPVSAGQHANSSRLAGYQHVNPSSYVDTKRVLYGRNPDQPLSQSTISAAKAANQALHTPTAPVLSALKPPVLPPRPGRREKYCDNSLVEISSDHKAWNKAVASHALRPEHEHPSFDAAQPSPSLQVLQSAAKFALESVLRLRHNETAKSSRFIQLRLDPHLSLLTAALEECEMFGPNLPRSDISHQIIGDAVMTNSAYPSYDYAHKTFIDSLRPDLGIRDISNLAQVFTIPPSKSTPTIKPGSGASWSTSDGMALDHVLLSNYHDFSVSIWISPSDILRCFIKDGASSALSATAEAFLLARLGRMADNDSKCVSLTLDNISSSDPSISFGPSKDSISAATPEYILTTWSFSGQYNRLELADAIARTVGLVISGLSDWLQTPLMTRSGTTMFPQPIPQTSPPSTHLFTCSMVIRQVGSTRVAFKNKALECFSPAALTGHIAYPGTLLTPTNSPISEEFGSTMSTSTGRKYIEELFGGKATSKEGATLYKRPPHRITYDAPETCIKQQAKTSTDLRSSLPCTELSIYSYGLGYTTSLPSPKSTRSLEYRIQEQLPSSLILTHSSKLLTAQALDVDMFVVNGRQKKTQRVDSVIVTPRNFQGGIILSSRQSPVLNGNGAPSLSFFSRIRNAFDLPFHTILSSIHSSYHDAFISHTPPRGVIYIASLPVFPSLPVAFPTAEVNTALATVSSTATSLIQHLKTVHETFGKLLERTAVHREEITLLVQAGALSSRRALGRVANWRESDSDTTNNVARNDLLHLTLPHADVGDAEEEKKTTSQSASLSTSLVSKARAQGKKALVAAGEHLKIKSRFVSGEVLISALTLSTELLHCRLPLHALRKAYPIIPSSAAPFVSSWAAIQDTFKKLRPSILKHQETVAFFAQALRFEANFRVKTSIEVDASVSNPFTKKIARKSQNKESEDECDALSPLPLQLAYIGQTQNEFRARYQSTEHRADSFLSLFTQFSSYHDVSLSQLEVSQFEQLGTIDEETLGVLRQLLSLVNTNAAKVAGQILSIREKKANPSASRTTTKTPKDDLGENIILAYSFMNTRSVSGKIPLVTLQNYSLDQWLGMMQPLIMYWVEMFYLK